MSDQDCCFTAGVAFRAERDEIVGAGAYLEAANVYARAHELHSEDRNCPDQYVGKIDEIIRCGAFPIRDSASSRPSGKCVLLVLESPHKDEFGEQPGPAKGGTGRNITKFIHEVHGLADKGSYGLVLINAVQHPCSLGLPTHYFRDRLFRSVWHGGGEACFRQRLQSIYKSGDCVVNSCTRGKTRRTEAALRDLVQRSLVGVVPDDSILQRSHPISWHFSNRRGARAAR